MGSTAERISDFRNVSRVFSTRDVRATGRRSLSCFGVDFFGTGITVDIIPERRIMVYGGLEEMSTDATELVSTELQNSAVNTSGEHLEITSPVCECFVRVYPLSWTRSHVGE